MFNKTHRAHDSDGAVSVSITLKFPIVFKKLWCCSLVYRRKHWRQINHLYVTNKSLFHCVFQRDTCCGWCVSNHTLKINTEEVCLSDEGLGLTTLSTSSALTLMVLKCYLNLKYQIALHGFFLFIYFRIWRSVKSDASSLTVNKTKSKTSWNRLSLVASCMTALLFWYSFLVLLWKCTEKQTVFITTSNLKVGSGWAEQPKINSCNSQNAPSQCGNLESQTSSGGSLSSLSQKADLNFCSQECCWPAGCSTLFCQLADQGH